MNTAGVLARIQASGLTLRATGNHLIADSDQPLTEQQRQFIRRHKGALLRALEPPGGPTATAGNAAVTPSSAATEPEPSRNEANRQAMPHLAGMVDEFRRVFGADQVKVVFAEENGVRLGQRQAEPKAGTCYYCRHWCGTKSGNGYCVVGFAPPLRRQADDTCDHFTGEGRS